MKNDKSEDFFASLKEGLKYPWNNAKRLWNILWVLIPIYGWFAILGYTRRIIQALVKGDTKGLPEFGSSFDNFKRGFIIFVFMIPTIMALMLLNVIPFIGSLIYFLAAIFIVPWLVLNFMVNDTFSSLWELKKAFDVVFNNAVEYIFAYLKTLVFIFVYSILSIVLVGVPCYAFGNAYFLAEFYRKHK